MENPDSKSVESKQSDNILPPNVKKKRVNILLLCLGIILLVITLVVIFLILNPRNNTDNANEAVYIADGANKTGDFPTTKENLKKAVTEAPDDPDLLAALITTIANEGSLTGTEEISYQEGFPYIQKGLKDYPRDVDLLIAAGLLHEVSSRYNEALDYYDKALAIDPKNANGMFHKAHVLEFLGNTQKSDELYLKAYELDNQNPYIVMAIGKMALTQGKIDDAVAFYKAASQIPEIPAYLKAEALINASIIRRSQFVHMDESLKLAYEAVDAYPLYSPALAALGFTLGINGNIEEGVIYMQKAISTNPRISQNYWHSGMLYRSVKEYPSALDYFNEAYTRVDSDNTLIGDIQRSKVKGGIAYDIAKTTYLTGSTERVVFYLTEALKYDPSLKQLLKDDIEKYNQFTLISANSEILTLIE